MHHQKEYYVVNYIGNTQYYKNKLLVRNIKFRTVYTHNLLLAREFSKDVTYHRTLFAKGASALSISCEEELNVWNNSTIDLELDRLTIFTSKIHPEQQIITTARMMEDYYEDWIARCGEEMFCMNPSEFLERIICPYMINPWVKERVVDSINTMLMIWDGYPTPNIYHGVFETMLCSDRLDFVSLFYLFDRGR